MMKEELEKPKVPSLMSLLKPYSKLIWPLVIVVLICNALTLWLPKLVSVGVDNYFKGLGLETIFWQFFIASVVIFVLTFVQNFLQSVAAENVAKDLRDTLTDKISKQSFAEIQKATPAKLLTNLTSDIDAVKTFVSQAIVNLISSIVLLIGGSILLLSVNWKLGLAVLLVLPIVAVTFAVILGKLRTLFMKTREMVDWLNRVINESIVGAPLVRVLNSQRFEFDKFAEVNAQTRDLGMGILKLFSAMIPIITFAANLATLTILILGGKFVISGSMSFGDFAAFNTYLAILIFPIFIIGFVSNLVAQAQAAFSRVSEILDKPDSVHPGTLVKEIKGGLELKNVSLELSSKNVLKNVSFKIEPGSRVAIIGPTAAGKTQLLNLLIGLTPPTSGEIVLDGSNLEEYERENLYKQVGIVFQDSVVFNLSLRENIAFNTEVTNESLDLSLKTAELSTFVDQLENGLDTLVSERGTSLSGGQKQRMMLARALAINPKLLLLDDFTARVDSNTESKILANIEKNYSGLTLLSVTQKVVSVKEYDKIILLMEGELIAVGTHTELMTSSPEYVQIYNSQKSTETI